MGDAAVAPADATVAPANHRDLRASSFAGTPDPASSLRNRTRVAGYLHQRLE